MMETPRKILLATDLGARSDRALDRAVSIMRQCEIELVAVHVLERDAEPSRIGGTRPDLAAIARRKLSADLAPDDRVTVRIEDGEPADVILRVTAEEKCTLIVTGVARNEVLGRFTLGKTVEGLLRNATVPMLLVAERARAPYRNIVVAVDFTEASRRALDLALSTFPRERLTVFHAFEAPLSYAAADLEKHRDQFRRWAQEKCDGFLQTNLSDEDRARLDSRIEWGDPDLLLREIVQTTGVDLVVLATHGRAQLAEFFLGSVAKRIVALLPCDALVVPAKGM